MIIVSIDPSINPKNFGVALFDTSTHQDPLECLSGGIQSPEELRKARKDKVISAKSDPDGKFRSEYIADWFKEEMDWHSEWISEVVLLTEALVNKSSWASTPSAKSGRAKKMSLTQRANDYIMATAHILGIRVIELDPAKYRSTKIERSQKLDMILGTDREPRNEHVDDAIHRGSLWIREQRLTNKKD
jgi:hypothetical protein